MPLLAYLSTDPQPCRTSAARQIGMRRASRQAT